MNLRRRIPLYLVLLADLLVIAAFIIHGNSSVSGIRAFLARLQVAPAMASLVDKASVASAAVLVFHVVLALFFGRFHCALLCPLGALQELVYFWERRKRLFRRRMRRHLPMFLSQFVGFEDVHYPIPNLKWLRYAILAGVATLLLLGFASGFLVLDPYSTASRMFVFKQEAILWTLVAVPFIPLVVWLQKRTLCANICPIGTLLGLLSRHSIWRLRIADSCVRCGACARACPTACVKPSSGTIDNERCVRCMECMADCPVGAITLDTGGRAPSQQAGPQADGGPANPSRRAFLRNTAAVVVGTAAGLYLVRRETAGLPAAKKRLAGALLPPGAGGAERFTMKCTGCALCVGQCPSGIIRTAPYAFGPVSLHLSQGRGICDYDCNRCGTVCPTGAIPRLSLEEKRKTPIGLATIDFTKCLVLQGDDAVCGKCAETCPAKAIELLKGGAPKPPRPNLCIGCGACAKSCPASAIAIGPVNAVLQI